MDANRDGVIDHDEWARAASSGAQEPLEPPHLHAAHHANRAFQEASGTGSSRASSEWGAQPAGGHAEVQSVVETDPGWMAPDQAREWSQWELGVKVALCPAIVYSEPPYCR